MEFKIQRKTLINGLYSTQSVAERKSTMPILSNVLLEVKGKQISFIATDLEVGIVSRHQAEVIKPGKVVVPAKNFYDIAKELPDELVSIKVQSNNWLDIICGKSKFKIVGGSPEDFPNLPTSEGEAINIEAKVLIDMIDKVSYAMSMDETRYTLNGVCIELKGTVGKQNIKLVATDGHRLSYTERPIKGSLKLKNGVILPRKGVWELKKMLDGVEKEFSLMIGEKTIAASTDSTTLVCRLIDGQFPPYEQVIPKENNRHVIVDRHQFIQSLKRVSIIANEKAKGIRFSISSGNLDISSSNPDVGEAKEEILCSYKGEIFEIGFNARYFLDIIGVLEDDKVTLELKNDTSPCIIRSALDQGFLAVVMPMRL